MLNTLKKFAFCMLIVSYEMALQTLFNIDRLEDRQYT